MEQPTSIKIDNIEYIRKDSVRVPSVKPGESLYKLGQQVLLRSVTYHYLGRISFLSDTELVLEDASWLASSCRFSEETLKAGKIDEVEPFIDPVSISRGAIVDITLWRHPLPREAK